MIFVRSTFKAVLLQCDTVKTKQWNK